MRSASHVVFWAVCEDPLNCPMYLTHFAVGKTASPSDFDVPELLRSIDTGLVALQRQCNVISETIAGVHRRIDRKSVV